MKRNSFRLRNACYQVRLKPLGGETQNLDGCKELDVIELKMIYERLTGIDCGARQFNFVKLSRSTSPAHRQKHRKAAGACE